MVVLISELHGSAYTLNPDYPRDSDSTLYATPLYKDGTYSSNFNDYYEVDYVNSDEDYAPECKRIHDLLATELSS